MLTARESFNWASYCRNIHIRVLNKASAILIAAALYFIATPNCVFAENKKIVEATVKATADQFVGSPQISFKGGVSLNGPEKTVSLELDVPYQLELSGSFVEQDMTVLEGFIGFSIGVGSCYDVTVKQTGPEAQDPQTTGGGATAGLSAYLDEESGGNSATFRITVSLPKSSPENDFGSKGSSGGGGCGCSGSTGSTEPPPTIPKLDFSAGMGRDSSGEPVGYIKAENELSSGLLTRSDLQFSQRSTAGGIETMTDGGGLRQVLAPEGLADVVEMIDGSIELRFYPTAQIGAKTGGIYAVTGNPLVVQKLSPASDPNAGDGIIVSDTRNGTTKSEGFYGTGSSSGSVERTVDAAGKITEVTTTLAVDPLDSTKWERMVVIRELVVVGGVEQEVALRQEEYASRGWGEVLDRVVEDPNGANLVTLYGYYEDQVNDGAFYTKKKHTIEANGNWQKSIYDEAGWLVAILKPWKDLPAHPDDATLNNCVVESYSYDDEGNVNQIVKTIAGVQVSKSLISEIVSDEEVWEGSTLNLVTEEERRYHASETSYLLTSRSYLRDYSSHTAPKGKLYRTVSADGTAMRIKEEFGNYDENTGVFMPTVYGLFTRRIEAQGTSGSIRGLANRSIRNVSISDLKGVRRQEKQVFNGTDYETIETSVFTYESQGRRRLSVAIDGSIVSSTSFVSDLESSTIDAYGIHTTNTYDLGGRLVESVKEGVSAGSNYEAQPAITTTYTTSGLTRTVTVSAATLTQSTIEVSDKMGRQVSRTDEQGRTFTTSYANGGRTVTETRPGAVTVVTDYYRDGQIKSVTGSGVIAEYHDYTLDENANVVQTVYIGTGDNTSSRWRKSASNGLGQLVYEITPGPNGNQINTTHHYNNYGQRIKTTKTGMADTLFAFDELGQLFRQGTDMNGNGVLDLVSADPISESGVFFERDGTGNWWSVSQVRRYLSDSNDTDFAHFRRKNKLGMGSESETQFTDERGNATIEVTTINRGVKSVMKSTTSDLSNLTAIELTINGFLVSRSSLTVADPFLYHYDALGRQVGEIDPRTDLEAVTTYNALGQIQNVVNRDGGTTTFTYYSPSEANAGAVASQTNGENEAVRYAYDSLGRLTHKWGNGTYPIKLGYNNYGERNELKTFQATGDWDSSSLPTSFATAIPSTTAWNYHYASGALLDKANEASEAVVYSYYNNGLLHTRTWARGVVTTYAYDEAGRLTSVNYSDSTPSVSMNYRRDGQKISVQDASGSHVYAYHEGTGMIAGETVTTGVWDGVTLAWGQEAKKRLGGFSAQIASMPLTAVSYGYDLQGRLNSVNEGDQEAVYGFTPSSNLLHTTTLKSSGATRLTGAKLYDSVDRLQSLSWSNGITAASSLIYTYDSAGRRTLANQSNGSYWSYGYNSKGEVESAVKRDSNNTIFPGLSHGYQYDELGNRRRSTVDAAISGTRDVVYSTNVVNQYDSIQTPNSFDVTGSAESSADVKVNNLDVQRLGPYFRRELTTNNLTQSRWEDIVIDATLTAAGIGGADIQTKREGHIYHPRATQDLSYDEDGNLLNDGRWMYGWDAENRLITMETALPALSVGVPKRILSFTYDAIGRRVAKAVGHWDHAMENWAVTDNRKFVYDGWNMVAEMSANNTVIATNVWGIDMSGELQEAGGVGGILWSHISTQSRTMLYGFDGNGNVICLYEASDGRHLMSYEYGAFGQLVAEHSLRSPIYNPWGFSSKYKDSESGLSYYGYRYYSAEMGRWVSRDPIEEEGGINLYGMVGNDLINGVDLYGLRICHRERVDYKLGGWKFNVWKIKAEFSLTIRGQITVCDDCTRELAGRLTGQLAGQIPLWTVPGFTVSGTASGELHGQVSAKWTQGKQGIDASGSVRLAGWGGLMGGNDVASVGGDIGANTSWTFDFDYDGGNLNVRANGQEVNFNARARVTVSITSRWKYNQEILRYQTQIGIAPDFDFDIPLTDFSAP